jgi:DNA-binding transcriptional MerR regulator
MMTKAESILVDSFLKNDQREFFRIRDASLVVGVKPYVLRFWEAEFSLLKPEKSPTGQRVYRRRDIVLLFWIKKLLYQDRYSIEGANQKLKELRAEGALKTVPGELVLGSGHEPVFARTLGLAVNAGVDGSPDLQGDMNAIASVSVGTDPQAVEMKSPRSASVTGVNVSSDFEVGSQLNSRSLDEQLALENLARLSVKNLAALF